MLRIINGGSLSPRNGHGPNLSFLWADDNDAFRRAIHACLSRQDFDLWEAVDGQDAIEQARKLKPDLILLDVAMPRTNGIVAAPVLKDLMPNVRIVFFTMYSEAESIPSRKASC